MIPSCYCHYPALWRNVSCTLLFPRSILMKVCQWAGIQVFVCQLTVKEKMLGEFQKNWQQNFGQGHLVLCATCSLQPNLQFPLWIGLLRELTLKLSYPLLKIFISGLFSFVFHRNHSMNYYWSALSCWKPISIAPFWCCSTLLLKVAVISNHINVSGILCKNYTYWTNSTPGGLSIEEDYQNYLQIKLSLWFITWRLKNIQSKAYGWLSQEIYNLYHIRGLDAYYWMSGFLFFLALLATIPRQFLLMVVFRVGEGKGKAMPSVIDAEWMNIKNHESGVLNKLCNSTTTDE